MNPVGHQDRHPFIPNTQVHRNDVEPRVDNCGQQVLQGARETCCNKSLMRNYFGGVSLGSLGYSIYLLVDGHPLVGLGAVLASSLLGFLSFTAHMEIRDAEENTEVELEEVVVDDRDEEHSSDPDLSDIESE